MLNLQTVRELALSLLHVEEHIHWERPAFRVNKKIFATLWPLEQQLIIKLSLADQAQLTRQDATTYLAVKGKWGQQGYTIAQFDNLQAEECHRLLLSSWRLMAPKGFIVELEKS